MESDKAARQDWTIKTADARGRVNLGAAFANAIVALTYTDPTEVVISKAQCDSETEEWLFRNPRALRGLLQGLEESERGEFVKTPPDFEADMEEARRALKEAGFDADG
jgi:PHD/YefM family antitoxin component YafN of YafNO toxin-antitoxin module